MRAELSHLPGKYDMWAGVSDTCYLSRPDLPDSLHCKRAELPAAHSARHYLPGCKLHERRAAVSYYHWPYLCWTPMLPNRGRPNLRRATLPKCRRPSLPVGLEQLAVTPNRDPAAVCETAAGSL